MFDALTKLVSFKRCRTIAYHPETNGIIKLWHRFLKIVLMCHGEAQQMDTLPIVLLGLRTCFTKDLCTSVAELVYGTSLKIPCVFFFSEEMSSDPRIFIEPIPHDTKMNVIYKIKCNDCDATYVGQTKRKLITRVNEHRNHIRRNTSKSVITDHRLDHNHEFDWNNVDILDCKSFYHKRLISETLYITTQSNGLNLKTDTDGLDRSYADILDKLININLT
ncbi:hypothetical protein ALC62_15366 [Cyphomyrmex costatus]|uniref:GIY-YIG domain-containing protein n=1 Tax=Cyphomyrmex costatus TaxID=456900 RepID=A0A151I755_9HYME|nr:hypothetical protein ALC62_15366 [Cyphomyrmex costatus]